MLLEVKNASKTFRARRGAGQVHAVKAANLRARPGEFVAILCRRTISPIVRPIVLRGLSDPDGSCSTACTLRR